MTNPQSVPAAISSRTALVTFIGAVVRQLGGWMPIAGAVDLLGELGIDESIVRTGVSRLKSRGWLVAEKHGSTKGYALSPLAHDEFDAGDAIIWHAPEPARLEDGWCIVNFTVPEAERSIRHQLRARLTAAGFGRAGAALWIAPARVLEATRLLIDDLDLAAGCTVFVGRYAGERDLAEIIQEGWDLEALATRYHEFIDTVSASVATLRGTSLIEPARAFAHYLTTVDRWRRLPYDDPGLPRELVGSAWPAAEAGTLFEQSVTSFRQVALDYAGSRWPAP